MSTRGFELVYLETHNWGKSAAFWQALGFKLDSRKPPTATVDCSLLTTGPASSSKRRTYRIPWASSCTWLSLTRSGANRTHR